MDIENHKGNETGIKNNEKDNEKIVEEEKKEIKQNKPTEEHKLPNKPIKDIGKL